MKNKKTINLSNGWALLTILLVFSSFMISCGETNSETKKEEISYDPSKPVIINTFYPDSGKYLEKVLLTGSNCSTDPTRIRVYINSKKAAVSSSTGERMYALARRLPGETCTISGTRGNGSVVYDT